ncbi:MAG: glycosyltransferase family 2 protein [Patescibacteria group bacterium]|nr:glycosyltransferase family 2 protein [Patescibacteria group bacterium]
MMKKVFLLILNWNGGEMTVNCLNSLQYVKTDNFDLQVVVVDNASTDESINQIKVESEKLKVKTKILQNKENLGYAEGNNVGIRYALENGADFVCLLNNDTRVDPSFINELVKTAGSDEKIGIVGGKIYFEKGYEFHKDRYSEKELGKVIWYAGGKIDWQNVYASHLGVDEVDNGQFDQVIETDFVNGCLMLVKREVFVKAGLIDNNYFLYLEDTDFSMKAKRKGFKLYYTPLSKIWHLNGGSSGAGSKLQDYFITRNRLLFGMKWAPLRSKIALIKESFNLLFKGREWQKIGIKDFYISKFAKGSWQ